MIKLQFQIIYIENKDILGNTQQVLYYSYGIFIYIKILHVNNDKKIT